MREHWYPPAMGSWFSTIAQAGVDACIIVGLTFSQPSLVTKPVLDGILVVASLICGGLGVWLVTLMLKGYARLDRGARRYILFAVALMGLASLMCVLNLFVMSLRLDTFLSGIIGIGSFTLPMYGIRIRFRRRWLVYLWYSFFPIMVLLFEVCMMIVLSLPS